MIRRYFPRVPFQMNHVLRITDPEPLRFRSIVYSIGAGALLGDAPRPYVKPGESRFEQYVTGPLEFGSAREVPASEMSIERMRLWANSHA